MMTPKQIRAELILHDKKVTGIARKLKLPHSNVSSVIAGHQRMAHVREAIAHAINKKVSEIWPESAKKEGNK